TFKVDSREGYLSQKDYRILDEEKKFWYEELSNELDLTDSTCNLEDEK
ncbi:5049_t:CDS:1, partial [Dentiscutata erythropus]